jgi:hypothetical protein
LFYGDHGVQLHWLSTQGIRYHIGLAGVIVNFHIIVLNQLYPSALPHIQLFLGGDILQALVIRIDVASITHEVMTPNFQG